MNVRIKRAKKTKAQGPLSKVYRVLFGFWGPQGWWPGQTRLEIIVGAILTQNTAWTNVEKAIRRLKQERALDLKVMRDADHGALAEWIRSAGYFNVKARRLKSFVNMMFDGCRGSLNRLFARDTGSLRQWLLAVNGIGPETADSILLYAGNRPVFVVDAYTRRFMIRHGWASDDVTYDELAARFTDALPRDATLFNEYHALIVMLGKTYCRSKPLCEQCPLRGFLPPGGPGKS